MSPKRDTQSKANNHRGERDGTSAAKQRAKSQTSRGRRSGTQVQMRRGYRSPLYARYGIPQEKKAAHDAGAQRTVQRTAATGDTTAASAIQQAASHGTSGPGTQLPHAETIQRSFGSHSVSDVRAHTGTAASESANAIGARAYATGNHVVFDGAPNLHTAAHEAAHVMQQRGGGVQLEGGVGQTGDKHEQHADAVADRVVQGRSAQDLLDTYTGNAGSHDAGSSSQTQRVQLLANASADRARVLLQNIFAIATPAERASLIALIEDNYSGLEPQISVPLNFEFRGMQYQLRLTILEANLARNDAHEVSLAAAGEAQEHDAEHGEPGVAHPGRAHGRVRSLSVPDLRDGFVSVATQAITELAGSVGEENELHLSVRIPIYGEVCIASDIRLTIAHEEEGIRMRARPVVGFGIGLQTHADLLTGTNLDVRGHDAATALRMISLALEQKMRSMGSEPPPPVVLGAISLATGGMALPMVVGMDLGTRLYNRLTTGEWTDPFWPWLADQVWGENYARTVFRTMHDGDFAETYDDIAIAGHAAPEGADPEVEGSLRIGAARHNRVESEAGAAHRATYNTFDIQGSLTIHGIEGGIEIHVPTSHVEHTPEGVIKFKLKAMTEAEHLEYAFLADTIIAIISEVRARVGSHGRTEESVDQHLAAAQRQAAMFAGFAHAALAGAAIESIPGAEIGLELELEFPMGRGAHPKAVLSLVEEVGGSLAGERLSGEHKRIIDEGEF